MKYLRNMYLPVFYSLQMKMNLIWFSLYTILSVVNVTFCLYFITVITDREQVISDQISKTWNFLSQTTRSNCIVHVVLHIYFVVCIM